MSVSVRRAYCNSSQTSPRTIEDAPTLSSPDAESGPNSNPSTSTVSLNAGGKRSSVPTSSLKAAARYHETNPYNPPPPQAQAQASLKARAEQQIRDLFELQRGPKRDFVLRALFDENRVSKANVFATTREINIKQMEAIGFDYDYTLANYSPEIQPLIYNMARDYMVKSLKYPVEFATWAQYDANFAIRGLYYDTLKGTLMKLDYLNNVQPDTMYFGKRPLTKQQIIKQYGTLHISTTYFDHLRPMLDNFSLPEACLISDTIEFFVQHKISFDCSSVWQDVSKAIRFIHNTLALHNEVMRDLPRYLRGQRPRLVEFLEKLNRKRTRLFLLTNSPFYFVDAGMSYMLGPGWRDLFDTIIVSADKPAWFTATGRPFRRYHVETQQLAWDRVSEFERSQVYVGGSMDQFTKMYKVPGHLTLYLGDHIFSDLKEPSRTQGWRTGAIVSELEKEIEIQKTLDYNETLVELIKMQDLRNKLDMLAKDKEATVLFEIKDEIKRLRHSLKVRFNEYFGSVFRTHTQATVFAYLCQRYADLYTSNVENFLEYPFDYVHPVKRTFLPHEIDIQKYAQNVSINLPKWL